MGRVGEASGKLVWAQLSFHNQPSFSQDAHDGMIAQLAHDGMIVVATRRAVRLRQAATLLQHLQFGASTLHGCQRAKTDCSPPPCRLNLDAVKAALFFGALTCLINRAAKDLGRHKSQCVLGKPKGFRGFVLEEIDTKRIYQCKSSLQGFVHQLRLRVVPVAWLAADEGRRDFFSQNHRITESYRLEKTFKIIESNHKPNTAKNHHYTMSLSTSSKRPLNTSRDGDSTTSLGSLFQGLITLSAKQSQLPQPLLIRLLLQTLHQLRCPSLDTLQHLNIPLVVGGPKLNTVFEVRPHQCRVQGHNHFPSPAGHAIFDTGQDAIGLLGRLGTLLAHIQAAVNQHPQVLLCLAAFQPLFPKPVVLHGVAVAQVQDLALGLVKPHTIHPSPSIQPVQVPLQSLPTLQQINTPTQLGVVCKLTESALDPFVQIIDKDVKQDWPQHRALGNTACDRPPTGVNSIHHHSLGPAVQPVLYPAKSTPVQATSSQFLQENAVGNRVKGFTEV
ncbi:hypothetical protein QYF61_009936 [Mycteria americana]|uniref:Uncharacterized protein n=1 Tax=Mycteria americana TaxID=33587 RepID=A0AAN7RTK5_MYCAM|nr:hypothetical protein QYF61_009936 [Mycteria americana]